MKKQSKKKPQKQITFFVFTNSSGQGKKWIIPSKYLKRVGVLFCFMLILTMAIITDYIHLWSNVFEIKRLKAKEVLMAKQMSILKEKLHTFESSLNRMKVFNQKLKTITSPLDEEVKSLQLVMGPIDDAPFQAHRAPSNVPSYPSSSAHSHQRQQYEDEQDTLQKEYSLFASKKTGMDIEGDEEFTALIDSDSSGSDEGYVSLIMQINESIKESQLEEQNAMDLWSRLSEKKSFLFSTPSLTPVRGWLSSSFGYRRSPFTNKVTMHNGVDIASAPGAPIHAPADGVVIYTGYERGYGNLVAIDHGRGLVTRYGHNAENKVHIGQEVKRGQIIAIVGNTGRSTGHHLHYEVRKDSIPVNPVTYFLD